MLLLRSPPGVPTPNPWYGLFGPITVSPTLVSRKGLVRSRLLGMPPSKNFRFAWALKVRSCAAVVLESRHNAKLRVRLIYVVRQEDRVPGIRHEGAELFPRILWLRMRRCLPATRQTLPERC